MAQDILITPGSGEPQILFRGSGVNDTAVELNVLSSYQSATGSGTALLFEGTQGQLFGITDNLSSGTIFSVSDITGLPSLEVNADGQVKICEYGSGTIFYNDLELKTGSQSGVLFFDNNLKLTSSNSFTYSDGNTKQLVIDSTVTDSVMYLKNYLNDTGYVHMMGGQRAFKVGMGSSYSYYGGAWLKLYAGAYLFAEYNNSDNLELQAENDIKLKTRSIVSTTTSTDIPLTVQGATSQSANLQEWQDDSSVAHLALDSNFVFQLDRLVTADFVVDDQRGHRLGFPDGNGALSTNSNYQNGITIRDGGATVNRNSGFYWNNGTLLYGGQFDTAITRPSANTVMVRNFTSDLGVLIASGVSVSGVYLANHTPASTTDTLYNDGTTLKFDGAVVPESEPVTNASGIHNMMFMSQATYDGLGSTDPNTVYFIV